jgi:molybdate transport system regulatory protein
VQAKVKVWVVFDDGAKLGQGRAAFLRLIDKLGSIKQAVEHFEMSYRNAWGYLRELERAAGFRLLERKAGGSRAAGTRLTPEGRVFLDRYDRFVQQVEERTAGSFDRTFQASVRPARRVSPSTSTTVRGRRAGRAAHKAT